MWTIDRMSTSALGVEPGAVVRLPTKPFLPGSKRENKAIFPMSHLDNARNDAKNYVNPTSEGLPQNIGPSSYAGTKDRHIPCYNAL